MFERLTDRARRVLALANEEAMRLSQEYIGTEHILLGLLREGSGIGAAILKNLGVDLNMARRQVEALVSKGQETVTMGKLPQTPRAKKVIEHAIEEARALGQGHVGTEHLLLGLLHERDGVAARVLSELGLELDDARREALDLLGKGSGAEGRTRPEERGAAEGSIAAGAERIRSRLDAIMAAAAGRIGGVPIGQPDEVERKRLLGLEAELRRAIVGQDAAVKRLAGCVRRYRAGLASGERPFGAFLLVGASGVGKTLLAQLLSRSIGGGHGALVHIDERDLCSVVPSREPSIDSDGVQPRARPCSVVLVESAENLTATALARLGAAISVGILADCRGRPVDLRDCLVLLTTTLESGPSGEPGPGAAQAHEHAMSARFGAGLINSLDGVIVLRSLSSEDLAQVLELELARVRNGLGLRGVRLSIGEAARRFLLAQGHDPSRGAGPVRRAVMLHVEEPLAERLLGGEIGAGATVSVGREDGSDGLTFAIEPGTP